VPFNEVTTMVNFLVTVGLVSVLPFVMVMLEREFHASTRTRAASDPVPRRRGHGAKSLPRGQSQREYQFAPVIYPAALHGQWSQQRCLSGPSEGSSLYGELVLPMGFFASASSDTVTGRSAALESFFQQQEQRMRLRAWTCRN
jgi:hypothetical protein